MLPNLRKCQRVLTKASELRLGALLPTPPIQRVGSANLRATALQSGEQTIRSHY